MLAHDKHSAHLLICQLLAAAWLLTGTETYHWSSRRSYLHLFKLLHDLKVLIKITLLLQKLLTLFQNQSIDHLLIELRLHHALIINVVNRTLNIIHFYGLRIHKQVVGWCFRRLIVHPKKLNLTLICHQSRFFWLSWIKFEILLALLDLQNAIRLQHLVYLDVHLLILHLRKCVLSFLITSEMRFILNCAQLQLLLKFLSIFWHFWGITSNIWPIFPQNFLARWVMNWQSHALNWRDVLLTLVQICIGDNFLLHDSELFLLIQLRLHILGADLIRKFVAESPIISSLQRLLRLRDPLSLRRVPFQMAHLMRIRQCLNIISITLRSDQILIPLTYW